jgi:hypothetical protein
MDSDIDALLKAHIGIGINASERQDFRGAIDVGYM